MVRFGYDGAGFAGWARQPGLRTVEGEILRGLARAGAGSAIPPTSLAVASRTDRGVSARGNALALNSELPAGPLLRVLNGLAPDIYFTHARAVPDDFRPRRALRRWYRYFEPGEARDLDAWAAAAARFSGRIDVRSFGRGMSLPEPVWRDVQGVNVQRDGAWFLVDLLAPSFVWGMVRKIVAALRAVEDGSLPFARLAEAIEGRARLTLPMAEAEGLVLWEVEYSQPWDGPPWRPTRHHAAARRAALVAARRREAITAALAESALGPSP